MKAKIWNNNFWVQETDPTKLVDMFNDILLRSGFTVLKFTDYHFEPFGYTALWLLGESHFAVHTFPEEGKTYCELSSCILPKYVDFVRRCEEF